MRSRCGSYQRRARSRSRGHSEYRRLPKVSTKPFQSSPARGGVGMPASAAIGSAAPVLEVGGVEKFQSAELHERDVPARQFDFKRTAVVRCPEQNRLLFEERARLAILQDAFDDEASLVGLVADGDELRFGSGRPLRPEVLGKTLLGETDD